MHSFIELDTFENVVKHSSTIELTRIHVLIQESISYYIKCVCVCVRARQLFDFIHLLQRYSHGLMMNGKDNIVSKNLCFSLYRGYV